MLDDGNGSIDFHASGTGPVLVFVPGSCSTGAAWRPVIQALGPGWTAVTTSLLGYGGTRERRTQQDTSIDREAEVVENVVRRAGDGVYLVGHSFGGLVALEVALRRRVPLLGLAVLEAPAVTLLEATGEMAHATAFREMTDDYFASFNSGNLEAIAAMIDFYGGEGTYAGWPQKARDYAIATTAVNIMDWASARGCALSPARLATVTVPALVTTGTSSHPAARRANELVCEHIRDARLSILDGAAHFMIATHAAELARSIAAHHAYCLAQPSKGST